MLVNHGKYMAQMLKMLMVKLTSEFCGLDFDCFLCSKIFPQLFVWLAYTAFWKCKKKEVSELLNDSLSLFGCFQLDLYASLTTIF